MTERIYTAEELAELEDYTAEEIAKLEFDYEYYMPEAQRVDSRY